MCQELRRIRKQHKLASVEGKQLLVMFCNILRKKHMTKVLGRVAVEFYNVYIYCSTMCSGEIRWIDFILVGHDMYIEHTDTLIT